MLGAPARRRQRAPAAGPRRCATRSCAARSSSSRPQPGGALGRGGRAPARRRMGARRPRCAARARAARTSCRPASRGARMRCACGCRRRKLGGQPQDALKTARLLVKHQGFSKVAAQGLLRSLAFEALGARARHRPAAAHLARASTPADRRDPYVAARAASRAVALGAHDEARAWLRPFWDQLDELGADERARRRRGARRRRRRHRRRMAAAPRGGGAGVPARRRDRARRRQRARRAPALGQGAAPARAGRERRRAARPRARRKAWVALAELAQREGDARARRAVATRRAAAARPEGRAAILRGSAAVAQLDRVLGYEPRGRGFESCQPHHLQLPKKRPGHLSRPGRFLGGSSARN